MDAVEAAHLIVGTRFPEASAAFLTGSALSARRTSTSDLDIVVVLQGPPAPYRETTHEHGWPVELFVQSLASIKHFSDLEAANQSAVTLQMISDGFVILSVDGEAERIQSNAIMRLKEGPPPISEGEMRKRRYMLTDQLDDFIGATDPIEILHITQQLLVGCSELALLSKKRWLSSGKWLPRALAMSDFDISDRLYSATKSAIVDEDKTLMEAVVREVLKRVGGPLTAGYKVEGQIIG